MSEGVRPGLTQATGPQSETIVVHRSWDHPLPVVVRGDGIYLYDSDGKRYIDGAGGSSTVVNIGHGVRSVVEAMYAQGKKLSFGAPHVFTNEPLLRLGRMVSDRAPGTLRNRCRIWFSCTGTDAVDDAARLARQYFVARGKPSRYVIIGRWQSFHGNNLAVSGMHGCTGRRRLYYPMYVDSPHIPPAYCYRCPFGDVHPGCGLKCANSLETMIRQIGEENVAAFIAEPVVGSALGACPAPDGYFQRVREICDRHEVLFIVDEVQTAWGRMGHWFGMEEYGVTPDFIATAKGLSSGYTPIAATIAREELWQAIEESAQPFLAGHTLNQNPVSCAGAIANLEYMEQHHLLAHSAEVGSYLLERLRGLLRFPIVGDARGKGLMCGFELVKDQKTKEPFDPKRRVSALLADEAFRRGLILYPCTGCVEGVAGDMMLVTPPLIITRQQVDEMMAITEQAIAAVQAALLSE